MWGYLWSILALAALCAAWVLFQLWLERQDPDDVQIKRACGGCAHDCRDEE